MRVGEDTASLDGLGANSTLADTVAQLGAIVADRLGDNQ